MPSNKLFSRRDRELPLPSPEVTQTARKRLLHFIESKCIVSPPDNVYFLPEVANFLISEYGELQGSGIDVLVCDPIQVACAAKQHFFACSDDQAIDFIQACFVNRWYVAEQFGVERVNAILREEGSGYEFTEYPKVSRFDVPDLIEMIHHHLDVPVQFPVPIRVTDREIHKSVVLPAVQLLRDQRLVNANEEMAHALEAFREGRFEDVLTHSGSAFESALKVICTIKNWSPAPAGGRSAPPLDGLTVVRLLELCHGNGLFDAEYLEPLKAVGQIRNRFGSAHGRGATGKPLPTQIQAEHILHLTMSNTLFVCRQAGIQ